MIRFALFLALAFFSSTALASSFPLDPLNAEETQTALRILEKNHLLGPTVMIADLALKEPRKSEILAYRPGVALQREAEAILYDRKSKRTWEITLDVTTEQVLENLELMHVSPSITPTPRNARRSKKIIEISMESPAASGNQALSIDGHEVRWGNWSFRFAMRPREGLVLYLVRYNDHGHWRSILYRGSMSEVVDPTQSPGINRSNRQSGRSSGSLVLGTEIPNEARVFDALFVDPSGKPYVTKNAVAVYEQSGPRPAHSLVISSKAPLGEYGYLMSWIFKQDGTLSFETELDNASSKSTTPQKAHKSPISPYFFNVRLDMDVDGTQNQIAELNLQPTQNSSFEQITTPLTHEQEAQRNTNPASHRRWIIYNPNSQSSLGYPAAYVLNPRESSPLLAGDQKGFAQYAFWATKEDDDELYAAGEFPDQRSQWDGLPAWVQKNHSLQNEDVVVWYSFCLTHTPRPEDWPEMRSEVGGFDLIPFGFFNKNPALDLTKK